VIADRYSSGSSPEAQEARGVRKYHRGVPPWIPDSDPWDKRLPQRGVMHPPLDLSGLPLVAVEIGHTDWDFGREG
jgi:hypothetical protein